MKILHSADWHVRDKEIEEIATCLRFIVDRAQAENVDLIVIAGDIFDSRDLKLDSKAAKLAVRTISELADIAPVAIVTGTASHDGMAPEVLRFARGKHFIHVSATPEQIYLTAGELSHSTGIGNIKPDAVLTMIPTPTKQYFNDGSIAESNENISQAMSSLFAGFGAQAAAFPRVPHLLVGHWNVSGAKLSNGQTLIGHDIDISIDQMSLTNAAAYLMGHIHMSQQMGDRTFYSGSPYSLTWGEIEEKGFWLHEFDADELDKSEFVWTPCRKLLRIQEDFTEHPDAIKELDVVLYTYSREEIEGRYVRADFTVWQDEAAMLDKERLKEFYLSAGAIDADIRIIRVPRQTVRSESVLKSETLRDKIIAMSALNNEPVSESILQKADALENTPATELVRAA